MNRQPFNLATAQDICEDFEDLIDTEIGFGSSVVLYIDNVLVCPFDENIRQKFAECYHQTHNAAQAMSEYSGNDYDVMVFATHPEEPKGYTYMDIRTFVEQTGISYNFPE
jgi:hypothetical protein